MKDCKNIEWIDLFKAFGIILVVFGHVFQNEYWIRWIYSFHMPLFVFASGWLYKRKENKSYIKKKIFTIMIPYFIFGMVELLYWQCIEKRFRISNITFVQALLGLISGNYALLEFNVHLWFLPCAFFIMILYNWLININKNFTYIIVLLISFFSVFDMPHLPFSINRIPELFIFYFVGNILAEIKFDQKIRFKNKYILFLFFSISLIITLFLNCYKFESLLISYFTAFLGIISFMIISILCERKLRCFKELGKESLVVLCIHGPVYRILVKVVSILLDQSTEFIRMNFICTIIIVIITVIISKIIYRILFKFFPIAIGKS